eukprot:CAMPEP_0178640406 /NCGR_PEP_ID=MMETSP0698-20121128/16002_1 /TAXON_ID=265572 /ORGANISM="Extubocellulus spinifer, Strain CCMP396" /LENGTH=471 /DNA_ID=CAMNT_0020280849 /DNA_START=54 /DNA_END=1469 /DNA_ORIENTATION=-
MTMTPTSTTAAATASNGHRRGDDDDGTVVATSSGAQGISGVAARNLEGMGVVVSSSAGAVSIGIGGAGGSIQSPSLELHNTMSPPDDDRHIVSWADLMPEDIAKVATFLPMGGSDVMNLLLCVGPGTAAWVRTTYLQGNDYYLLHCFGEEDARRRKSKLQGWMDHNEQEWKKRCHGLKSGSHVHSVLLEPEQAMSIGLAEADIIYCELNHLVTNGISDDAAATVKLLHKFSRRPILIAIGTTKVLRGTPEGQVRSLLETVEPDKAGNIVLSFIQLQDYVFVSPVCAIQLGLTNVLRYLVEKDLIAVNDSYATGSDQASWPLLLYAVTYFDDVCQGPFHYLLSCEGVDINAEAEPLTGRTCTIIHFCACVPSIPVSALKILLRHPNIDVNLQNSDGDTALHYACKVLDRAKAKALLESGANPEIVDAIGRTPIYYPRFHLLRADTSEQVRRKAGDILAYLENGTNAAAGNNA